MPYGMSDDYAELLELTKDPEFESEFFRELKNILFKLADEEREVFSANLEICYNPPRCKGIDQFRLTIMDSDEDIKYDFDGTSLKDICTDLKSVLVPKHPEEITYKGKKYKLIDGE